MLMVLDKSLCWLIPGDLRTGMWEELVLNRDQWNGEFYLGSLN